MVKYYFLSKPFFIVAVMLTGLQMQSQINVDSLKLSLKNPNQHDTLKLKTLAQIMFNAPQGSKDQIYYIDEIGHLAEKNLEKKNLSQEEIKTWRSTLGEYYGNRATLAVKSDPKLSLEFLEKGINIHLADKEYNKLAFAYVTKGITYVYLLRYNDAIKSYFQALKYFDNSPRGLSGTAYAHTAIAYIYNRQKDYKTALYYYNKVLHFKENIKEPNNSQKSDLADCYLNMGNIYLELNQFGNAERNYNKALTIAKEIEDKNSASNYLEKLGGISFKQKNYVKALEKYEEALDKEPVDMYKANVYNSLGELYIAQKKYDLAEQFLKKAETIAEKTQMAPLKQRNAKLLYQLYKESKEYSKSLAAYEAYVKMDSTDLDESKNVLKEQLLKYEFEKKQLQAELAQQKKLESVKAANAEENARKNLMLYVSVAVAILLLAGFVFLYYYFKQKNIINANKNNELKQKLLLTQMNPHFIFNSVDNIQSLIYAEKNEEAINYLTKFSKLTRQILENSTENYISLSEELLMTANYLVIQQLLYNNKFEYTIESDETIDADSILIPPMLTQPFIENAVKHGLKDKKTGGKIEVKFYMKDKDLLFEVLDNGSGLESKVDTGHKSLATQIVTERLGRNGRNLTIQTENIVIDGTVSGAFTKFEIPYVSDFN